MANAILLNRQIGAFSFGWALFVGAVLSTQAETCTWTGHDGSSAYTNSTVRWEAETWSPQAPGPTDTAYFPPNSANCCFLVTPPADFVGLIATTNHMAYQSGYATTFTQPTYIRVSPELSSAWKVTGSGTLIVTNGVTAANIDAAFCGTIMVPAGECFTATADISEEVEYTGNGELTITTAAQLNRVFGFHGKLVKDGDALGAMAKELVSYQGRELSLADGEAFALNPNLVNLGATEKMKGAFGGSYWSVNSNHAVEEFGHYYDKTPAPTTLADGTFVMADCPGQRTTAWYKGRKLRIGDDWGMKFQLIVTTPDPSQVTAKGKYQANTSGAFSIVMKDATGDEIYSADTTFDSARYVAAPHCYGTCWYFWNNNYHMMWRWDSNSYNTDGIWPEKLGLWGLNVRTLPEATDPIDIDVTCVRGVMSVTVGKNGRSFTYRRDFSSYMRTLGTGIHVGIGAESYGSAFSSDTAFWSLISIRNFSGWVRSREATEAWEVQTDVSTLSTANYTNETVEIANGAVVTNYNEAAYTTTGGIRLMTPTADYDKTVLRYTRGGLCSLYLLDSTACYLVSYDMQAGDKKYSDRWGGLHVGLVGGRNPDWIMTSGSRYGIARTDFGINKEVWVYGPYFYHNFRGNTGTGLLQFCTNAGGGKSRELGHDLEKIGGEAAVAAPENLNLHYDMFYDGIGYGLAADYRTSPVSGTSGGTSYSVIDRYDKDYFKAFVTVASKENTKDPRMRPAVWAGCDNNTVNLVLTGITVKKLVDNVNAYVPSTLEVGAGKTSSVALTPSHPASATPVATVREVALGTAATLNVTTADSAARLAIEQITANGAATLAAVGNGSVRLGGALRLGTADAKLSLVGSVSFETDTLDVTIPQATYAARRPTEVLDLSGATVATLPETVRVRTEDGTDVTARTRPAFEKGRLLLFPPRGFAILVR